MSAHYRRFKRWWGESWRFFAAFHLGTIVSTEKYLGFWMALATGVLKFVVVVCLVYVAAVVATLWIRAAVATHRHYVP